MRFENFLSSEFDTISEIKNYFYFIKCIKLDLKTTVIERNGNFSLYARFLPSYRTPLMAFFTSICYCIIQLWSSPNFYRSVVKFSSFSLFEF